MKNKNLYSICFCMALAGSLQTTYGQVDAEGVADSTLSAAGGETDSLQIVVQREMNKIPTVVYKGALVDAATGGPVQGGIIQVAGDDRFSSISDEQGAVVCQSIVGAYSYLCFGQGTFGRKRKRIGSEDVFGTFFQWLCQ